MRSILFAAALICLGSPGLAQDAFNLEETVATCAACHGEAGLPEDRQIPILWGQQFYYLYVQMKDFQAGRRANDIMSAMVADLSRDQMKAIAQHFADQAWPTIEANVDETAAAAGATGLTAGQCAACHGAYLGDSRVPRLAGQTSEYLEHTMQEFKQRVRMNAPDLNSLFGSFTDEQIHEMAAHLGLL